MKFACTNVKSLFEVTWHDFYMFGDDLTQVWQVVQKASNLTFRGFWAWRIQKCCLFELDEKREFVVKLMNSTFKQRISRFYVVWQQSWCSNQQMHVLHDLSQLVRMKWKSIFVGFWTWRFQICCSLVNVKLELNRCLHAKTRFYM